MKIYSSARRDVVLLIKELPFCKISKDVFLEYPGDTSRYDAGRRLAAGCRGCMCDVFRTVCRAALVRIRWVLGVRVDFFILMGVYSIFIPMFSFTGSNSEIFAPGWRES